MRVRGEEQVYLLCELLGFLPAQYIPQCERRDSEKKFGGALFSILDLLEGRLRRKNEELGWMWTSPLLACAQLRLFRSTRAIAFGNHNPLSKHTLVQTHFHPPLHKNLAKLTASCAHFLFCRAMQSYLTAYAIIAWNTNTSKTLPTLPSLEPLWSVNEMEKLPSGESPISSG